MTPEQRTVIEECCGRRIGYPPGALAFLDLQRVLRELLATEDRRAVYTRPQDPRYCEDCGTVHWWAHT